LQKCCTIPCAIEWGRKEAEKQAKREHAQAKKNLRDNDKPFQKKKAIALFNKYIRTVRDKDDPCISCQKHRKTYDAGHYRTRGAASQLTFDEDNCHKQCVWCNRHLSGNLTHYRIHLIEKIGIERVEALENNNTPKKWTIEEYKEIQLIYREKINGN